MKPPAWLLGVVGIWGVIGCVYLWPTIMVTIAVFVFISAIGGIIASVITDDI